MDSSDSDIKETRLIYARHARYAPLMQPSQLQSNADAEKRIRLS